MDRITTKTIERHLNTIKSILNQKDETWTRKEDGTLKATIGNLVLDHNISGFSLNMICNESGGEHDLSYRYSNKEMDAYMRGFIAALKLEDTKKWILG